MRVFSYKFTAPEVLAKNIISPATDLWGLAVTSYVLLSGGKYPYAGIGMAETLRAVRENKLENLSIHRSDIDPELASFLHRALDSEPSVRPASAREWTEFMDRILKRGLPEEPEQSDASTDSQQEESGIVPT